MKESTSRVIANVLFKSAAVVEKKKGVVHRVVAEAQPAAESRRTKDWPGRVLEHAAEDAMAKQGSLRGLAALGGAGTLAYLASKRKTKDKAKAKVEKAHGRTASNLSRFGVGL